MAEQACKIVLASASPRRQELLRGKGVDFEALVTDAEEIFDPALEPYLLCQENARIKAEAARLLRPDSLILAADTLVFCDGAVLGKPANMEEAHGMLRTLAGKTHQVRTGICALFPNGDTILDGESSWVTFHHLSDAQISAYLRLANPLDKAGSYGIQEYGGMIIEKIRGAVDNVMGLPLGLIMSIISKYRQSARKNL